MRDFYKMLDFDNVKEIILFYFYLIVALIAICTFIFVKDCFFALEKVERQELKIDDYKVVNIKKNLYLSKIFSVFMCVLMVLIVFLIFFFFIYEIYSHKKEGNDNN